MTPGPAPIRTALTFLQRLLRSALSVVLLAVLAGHAGIAAGASIAPRIIGGTNATNGQYPFMVALVSPLVTTSDLDAEFCGGTIVAANWVLTAGHCVSNSNGSLSLPGDIAVIAGVTTLDPNGATATRTPVDAIVRHPGYNNTTLLDDLALIHLASPVTTAAGFSLDDNTITSTLVSGSPVTAIGWGYTTTTGTTKSSVLQQVTLDYIPYSTCDDSAHYNGTLPATSICAGFLASPPRDTCNGDSGGPLLVATGGGSWSQVGITSFGDASGCAQTTFPGVYTQAGDFKAFVNGVQTEPDLAVTITTTQSPPYGLTVPVTMIIRNSSPVNAATSATLALARSSGVFSITGTDPAVSCSGSGDLSCTTGAIAAGGVVTVNATLDFPGPGSYILAATVSTPSGDYYSVNNSNSRQFTVPQPAHDRPTGGALPAGLLWLLAGTLALRRHRRQR